MAYEAQIEAAKAHFGKVLEEQLARVERLKQQPEWLDFNQIKPVKIGMIGGDGIGPTIAIESQRVLEYLLRDQVKSGRVEFRTIEGLTIENRPLASSLSPTTSWPRSRRVT
jgi:isocitrate dehydrogenase (NAD+)